MPPPLTPDPHMDTITLAHGGDYGDLIYGCCAARALCEQFHRRATVALYARTDTRQRAAWASERTAGTIGPLLLAQPWCDEVMVCGSGPPRDAIMLDRWRDWYRANTCTLAAAHLMSLGIPAIVQYTPWLEVPPATPAAGPDAADLNAADLDAVGWDIVINRTARYHNGNFPWRSLMAEANRHDMRTGFIGTDDEYNAFAIEFGRWCERCPTENLLDAARVIAGCKLFVGNQSACYAIAEGLKTVRTVQETWTGDANCVFPRETARYDVNGNTNWPEIFGSL